MNKEDTANVATLTNDIAAMEKKIAELTEGIHALALARQAIEDAYKGVAECCGRIMEDCDCHEEPEGWPHDCHDLSDDGDALASCGWGTDEDYGYYGGDDF